MLVLRDETERPEAIEAGCALLIGAERATIVEQVMRLSRDTSAYAAMSRAGNPFGDGTASAQIVEVLTLSLATALSQATTTTNVGVKRLNVV